MNITKEQIDELNATIQIEITEEDYQEKTEIKLREYRRKASMPGFRPGNVPMSIIKKMYYNSTLVDIIDKLTSESLMNYIKENNLDILGSPLHNEEKNIPIDFDTQKSFNFFFDIATSPEIKYDLEKLEVKYYNISVEGTYLDTQIESIRKSYGKDTNPEISEADDRLFAKFEELNDKKEIVEGGISNSASVLINTTADPKKLTGLKKGDTLDIDMKKLFKENITEISQILNISREEAEAIKSSFRISVEEIHRIEPADMDETFFKMVFPYADIKTEEDFRKELIKDLERQTASEADKRYLFDVRKNVLEQSAIQLPDAFMKRWILTTSEDKNITADKLEAEYDQYADVIKWQLIENTIMKENNISVTQSDIEDSIASWFVKPGEEITDEIREKAKQFSSTILQNKDEMKKINDRLYDEKLLNFFKEKIKTVNTDINLEDFIKLA